LYRYVAREMMIELESDGGPTYAPPPASFPPSLGADAEDATDDGWMDLFTSAWMDMWLTPGSIVLHRISMRGGGLVQVEFK
jgi:hypothetical protein